MPRSVPVLIVGGGPVGLALARELGWRGIACELIEQTDGAIGYFELSYATSQKISTVKVDTGAAQPVEATSDNASKAIAAAKLVGKGKDLAMDLDYTTQADGAYPIILVTYEIACSKGSPKAKEIQAFLKYTSSTAGQQELGELGYAPLPESLRAQVETSVAAIG